jgi:DNA-binding CsgD family transcriptional regulator
MKTAANLAKRETEIAELIAWGASKKEIADRLDISVHTVENTTRNIFTKIDIQKATELSVWWFCTKLNMSFDLSPLRRARSIAMLLMIRSKASKARKTSQRNKQNTLQLSNLT